ncbi:PUL domain-containing protein [Ilyonectria robusta]|uniref:PUL domain-containing protein n=1 Tax=Ilyonectria robusta TaxID=1079257 RepID=UPI001E8DF7FE|nr:PUL domain-containing protein [Ilyonectria robusta]KAH8733746.1 PUL domain-containing protein [Ilyonectria robusta]
MDVHLLVYDLSRGLARQMSAGILGFQLDAIYHTSIQVNGREYVYDGGIIAIAPGSSHLGQPMEKMHLGTTNLPIDVIEEFLDSLRPIFTLEAYDLFHHNCNNFSDSFSNFLVGKGIPEHISKMPQAVLDSPMGRMLLPQLTQGINAGRQNGSILGLQQSSQTPVQNQPVAPPKHAVKLVNDLSEFNRLLEQAQSSCAVVFFTSATCPPCKMLYPVYDELAQEFGDKVTLIKVDISQQGGHQIGSKFSIRATPTLITFLKGEQENTWSGADPAKLRGNVQLLVQMAFPLHPHEKLHLPSFSNPNIKPVLYAKVPPLDKLMAKMGQSVANKTEVQTLKHYLEVRTQDGLQDAIVPEMKRLSALIRDSVDSLPIEIMFTIVDLFRCALSDPRISGYFAEEDNHQTVRSVLDLVNKQTDCPYALRLVTLQLACNFFSSPLFPEEILRKEDLRAPIIQLISSSFLDESHNNVRVAASSLLFNLSLANRRAAQDSKPTLAEDDEIELAASVVESIGQEEKSVEALHGMLLALGNLVFRTSLDGQLADLLRALDAEGTILAKKAAFPQEKLITEVAVELLSKGLRKA